MKHRCLITIAAGALAASLGACATNVSTPESVRASGSAAAVAESATSFETVRAAVTFEDDPHMGKRTATGPEIRYLDPERNKWTDGYNIYHLRAFDIGRSGPDAIDFSDVQIRVRQSTQGDWPGYRAAYSQGEVFEVTRINSDVDCIGLNCLKTELVGIDMTMPQLRELAERPVLTFKIVGQRSDMIVEIPQSYLRGFLAAVDDQEAEQAF